MTELLAPFPTIHRVSAESFRDIHAAARHLIATHRARPGDVVVMLRGKMETARGIVGLLANDILRRPFDG